MPELPTLAIARLTFWTFVRFALDHDRGTAQVLNTGPWEAAHSSAYGCWVLARIEPFADVQVLDQVPGLHLRLMGAPFYGLIVYDILDKDGRTCAEDLGHARVEVSQTK
jgi:hypothetical protein